MVYGRVVPSGLSAEESERLQLSLYAVVADARPHGEPSASNIVAVGYVAGIRRDASVPALLVAMPALRHALPTACHHSAPAVEVGSVRRSLRGEFHTIGGTWGRTVELAVSSTTAASRCNPRSFARLIGDFRNAALNCQRARWAAAGRRVAPGPDGPRIAGGLRASPRAAVAAPVRRCERIWSVTEA